MQSATEQAENMNCECGAPFGKMRLTLNEKINIANGFYIIRRRVCVSCHADHYEQSE